MDIDSAEKKLTSVDKFLTTLKMLLKKHWGILLIILVVLFIYWVSTLDPITPERDQYVPYEPAYIESQEYLEEEQPQEYYEEPASEYPAYEPSVDVVYPE